MTNEKAIHDRVQSGLFYTQKGLTPFVAAQMKQANGEGWLHFASRAHGSGPNDPLDAYGLLKTMIDNWRDAFGHAFPRRDAPKVRSFVSVALDARNAVSHLSMPMQDDDALRYLDAMHNLLRAVKAPEASQLKALYDEQRASGLVVPTPRPAPSPTATLAETPTTSFEEGLAKPLRPWIEVALPHPDVLANRFKEAEFAADLSAVDNGLAQDDYATPEGFFRITFLTEGLKRVLTLALQRLAGEGGDPVIGLQTAFGGGKTHTLLALHHMARAADLDRLDGMAELARQAGVTSWRPAKVAVFVGTAVGPDMALTPRGGPRLRTLWGYLAWRLAGDEGLDVVREAEEARTNPGSEALVEVLRLAGPCVILLDELVAFARQLDDARFEAFLSFVQSLTEAAKMAPHAMVIGSLPESRAEAGGDRGVAALLRLERVFGRVQSAWLPAGGDESYEIVRRRLFQALDGDAIRARDETVKAFHDLYRKNAAEFPDFVREGRYLELLRLSYPIHPELFERLSKDWSTLEKFQRTRGVLKFMANVVGVLWSQQARDPLITPARVPLGNERVRPSALMPLDPAFGGVLGREVDGDGALPAQLEANPARRISQARAATRAARAVFLCSAPTVGQPNAGLNSQGLRLAAAEPGDQLAIFGEALREMKERAAYLYEEAGRYWYSTQPTLNTLAEGRARALEPHEVDEAIVKVLRKDAGAASPFRKVFAVPDDPTAVDEATAVSLVILGPGATHAGRAADATPATEAATEALTRCRTAQRRFRNTLVFVAPDEAQYATACEAMRRALAWEDIVGDKRLQAQITQGQAADAAEKAKGARSGADKAVRGAWTHVLYPHKDIDAQDGVPFTLERLGVSAKDHATVPAAVYETCRSNGVVAEKLGGETFLAKLRPLWPDDAPHLAISEIAAWFQSYPYLPKLRDRVVLEEAVKEALSRLDAEVAYADRYIAATDSYEGLALGRLPDVALSEDAVLVRAEVARARAVRSDDPQSVVTGGEPTTNEPCSPDGPAASRKPTRFFGSVELDATRPMKAFEGVYNAVVAELQRAPGAKVRLTLEVEAEVAEGFPDEDRSVVQDNAAQLKFNPSSTGFE